MKTNYLAVVISAIAYWVLGAVWYAALFAKPWVALEQMSEEKMRSASPVIPYVVTFLLNLVIAYALSQIIQWRNARTAGQGAAIGTLLWIGLVGPITFTTNMYELRPHTLWAINALYPLAGMILMGAILGAWKSKSA